MSKEFTDEIKSKKRFEFGRNWKNFLPEINDQRIIAAQNSLTKMLEVDSLKGVSFLDVGSGSGLFSLVAKKLGADVHSFDYDVNSVWCTKKLKDQHYQEAEWKIEQGSV